MSHYFIRATTNVGPVHFPVSTDCHSGVCYTISEAVCHEAQRRSIIVCSDWTAEPIDRFVYESFLN